MKSPRMDLSLALPVKSADPYPQLLFRAKTRAFSADLETDIFAFHGQNKVVGKGQVKSAGMGPGALNMPAGDAASHGRPRYNGPIC